MSLIMVGVLFGAGYVVTAPKMSETDRLLVALLLAVGWIGYALGNYFPMHLQ